MTTTTTTSTSTAQILLGDRVLMISVSPFKGEEKKILANNDKNNDNDQVKHRELFFIGFTHKLINFGVIAPDRVVQRRGGR